VFVLELFAGNLIQSWSLVNVLFLGFNYLHTLLVCSELVSELV
jgi:hypothetical protein